MQLDFTDKPIAREALRLATAHHAGIERKYTGEAYIHHPIRVTEAVLGAGVVDQNVLAAALLHDCLEDKNARGFTMADTVISNGCNVQVLRWVQLLSNTEKGNRAQRKAMASLRIANAPAEVRIIKLADIIDNCTGIVDHDPDFAETYLKEKRQMVGDMLTTGVPERYLSAFTKLRTKALNVIAEEMNKLAVFALEHGLAMEEERKADDALIQDLLDMDERSVFAEVAIF